MGKAKWWICDSCHSLNDLPANKCYKCRESKPANPRQMDDQYGEIASEQRVGITVDLATVGNITQPDPLETQEGGGFVEAFEPAGDEAVQTVPQQHETYEPHVPTQVSQQDQLAAAPPLREPRRRGIEQLGGRRQWAEGAEELSPLAQPAPPQPPQPVQPPPPSAMPQPPMPPAGQPAPPPPPAAQPAPPQPPQPVQPPPPQAAALPPPAAPMPPMGDAPPPAPDEPEG